MKFLDVPYIDQTGGGAFTGCESVSAVMLLNYLGTDIDIYEFIDRYLDKEPFTEKNGEIYGPDPRRCFAGDPYDKEAMGCYAPVIVNALGRIIGDTYEVTDETGSDVDDLCRRYIDNGMPVIIWATIDMNEYIEGPCWRLYETGEIFTWRSNEHCLLMVGYDEENYIFNDSWNNNGIVRHSKELFKDRYDSQYRQAVGVRPRTGAADSSV